MFQSTATVKYGPGLKAIAIIDQNIASYYRSLIPLYYYAQPQLYQAHITIVRLNKETPANLDLWGKYDGKIINFQYDPTIQYDGKYFFLNAQSKDIGDIREELGMTRFRDDRPFGGLLRSEYHITIANTKKK